MKVGRRAFNQRGVLIIWLALFLLLLIGFVAIGVDLAKLAATQGQLQTAADAAALAAGTAIDATTGTIVHDVAVARAQATGLKNHAYEMLPTPVVIPAEDIQIVGDTITVTARRSGDTPMRTHFAAALLGPALKYLDMSATAVAVVARSPEVCCGLIPVAAIPNTVFSPSCDSIYELMQDNGTGGSRYGFVQFPSCSTGACANVADAGGADMFRCLLENGYCCCIHESDRLPCKTGTMDGPFRQGLQARWDADTDQRPNICYSDYHGNQSRVVKLPVTSAVNGTGGNCYYTVNALAVFFLVEEPRSNPNIGIRGQFIEQVEPGKGTGGSGTAFNVHLIR